MSGIWPFFNSSYSNASINRILVEIEMDQQQLPMGLGSPGSNQVMTATRLLHSIQENDQELQQQQQQSQSSASSEGSPIASPNPSQETKRPLNQALLNKLLDQENLVVEINTSRNAKLIQYISQTDVIQVLIEYVLTSLDISLENSSIDLSEMLFKPTMEDPKPEGADISNGSVEVGTSDPLLRAIKRADKAVDILAVTATTSIMQTLLNPKDFSLLSKLWRGIMNRPATIYTKNADIPPADNQDEGAEASLAIETHNASTLNKFFKLIENFASFNIHGLMNFIRAEQTQEPEQTRSLTEQFLSFIPHFPQASDVLTRLIALDRPFHPTGIIDILLDQNLIYETLKLVRANYLSYSIQDNLCVFLNGIVGISSNVGFWNETNNGNESFGGMTEQGMNNGEIFNSLNGGESHPNNSNIGPNDLTRQLVSRESILEMMEIIVNHGAYGLVTCVSVVIEVIRKNNSDYDDFDWITSVHNENHDLDKEITVPPPSPRDPIYLGTMLKIFSAYLPEIVDTYLTEKYYRLRSDRLFHHTQDVNEDNGESALDKAPVYNRHLKSSIGKPIEPLGHERFKVMELIAELLHCSNMALMNKSAKLDYLILKRDQWRDVKQTEKLVQDALKDAIVTISPEPNTVFDYTNANKLTSELEELSLDDSKVNTGSTLHALSSTTLNSTKDVESLTPTLKDYIPTPFNLSAGCFFKYQLLQTKAIREIVLKMHRFPWNNFMHNVVFDLIQQIFNGRLLDEEVRGDGKDELYNDNFGMNKFLVQSFFGTFSDFDSVKVPDENGDAIPGSFNLPAYILFCMESSNRHEKETGFKLGYMGHLILIAEEIVKFQNILESIHLNQEDQDQDQMTQDSGQEETSLGIQYHESSRSMFDRLYLELFGDDAGSEASSTFQAWNDFINTQLIQIRDMYNQVLGGINPDDSSSSIAEQNSQLNRENGVILLDNGEGDNEEAIEDDYDTGFDDNVEVLDAEDPDDSRVPSPSLTFEDESLGDTLRPMSRYSDDNDNGDDDYDTAEKDNDDDDENDESPVISRGRSRD